MKDKDTIFLVALGIGLWFWWRNQNYNPGSFSPNAPMPGTGLENDIMPLTVSSAGREFIKQNEGFSAIPYNDANGQSIGYGHFIQAGENYNTISELQASNLLDQDLVPVENAINTLVSIPINQNQFDALADFTYNVGTNAFKNSTLLKMLNNGNYSGTAAQFQQWEKSGGANRRQAETNLFNA